MFRIMGKMLVRRTACTYCLFIFYLFINQAFLSATYTMTSGQLNIVLNCSIKIKFYCQIPLYAELNKKVFNFFLKSLVSVISLMSTGRPFHALGAATKNACSDETSLKYGKSTDGN